MYLIDKLSNTINKYKSDFKDINIILSKKEKLYIMKFQKKYENNELYIQKV